MAAIGLLCGSGSGGFCAGGFLVRAAVTRRMVAIVNEHLIITLDNASGISLQAQIRQSVVEAILGHSILPGDKLPSSRALAKQLKISRNTVILAYQALVDTGYLRPRERSGYVVSDDAPITRLVDTPGDQPPSDADRDSPGQPEILPETLPGTLLYRQCGRSCRLGSKAGAFLQLYPAGAKAGELA